MILAGGGATLKGLIGPMGVARPSIAAPRPTNTPARHRRGASRFKKNCRDF